MEPRWLIGLACGSGGEAVDAALVEVTGVGLDLTGRVLRALRRPLPRDVRELLARAPGDGRDLALLHRLLGEALASAAYHLAAEAQADPTRLFAAGFFGPLLWHEPGGRFPSTFELGMSAALAERSGLTVVGDFRARDLAAGGQGMPLSALPDFLLYRKPGEDRVLVHLGGASSVVFLPGSGRLPEVVGFEAGPCNRLLDGLIRTATAGREALDPGGKHAVQGRCLDALLARWEEHPFLHQRPPKSLPRSEFGRDFVAHAIRWTREAGGALPDLLCTAAHFVTRSIAAACKRWLPKTAEPPPVWLSGGGTRNGLLLGLLENQLAPVRLARLDELGAPPAARGAAAAAVLAALALDGVPGNMPGVTGAAGGRLLGRVTPGGSRNWARCLRWMAEQAGEVTPLYKCA